MKSTLTILLSLNLTFIIKCDDNIDRKFEAVESKINKLVEITEKQGKNLTFIIGNFLLEFTSIKTRSLDHC